jgi:peptidoglycan hydrolase-like protein with peptidoglycan-binding domain
MKYSKISGLTAYTMLLLSVGLLFGCQPPEDPKAAAGKESKEVVTEPAPVASADATAEPVTQIEDVQSIQSLESTSESLDAENNDADAPVREVQPDAATAEDQEQAVDDGDDVVKATPAIIRKVQQALADAGLNPGPVDGISGARTVSAIESFQKQNDIPAGKLTKRTLRALGVEF